MRGALLVFWKEVLELAKDRKTLLLTFVVPLVLYPVLFAMLARLGRQDAGRRLGRPSVLYVRDDAGMLLPLLKKDPLAFRLVAPPQGDLKQAVRDQVLELAVTVEPLASRKWESNDPFIVTAIWDESDASSQLALQRFKDALRLQDARWVRERLQALGAPLELNHPTRLELVPAGDAGRTAGKTLGIFFPYLVMIMMYAGSMQHGIYATAGEKERGTLLNLLATPLSRLEIIFGKLLYIFLVGLASALVNLVSMAVSVGWMLASEPRGVPAAGGGSLAVLASPGILLACFILMAPLGLFFANLILLGGIQARNTVEAGTALTPGVLVVMFLGVFSMAPGIEKMAYLPYVPVLNVSLAIRKLFSQQGDWKECVLAFAMTLGLAAVMTLLSSRLLGRESTFFKV